MHFVFSAVLLNGYKWDCRRKEFNELKKYQVKTIFDKGFDNKKYEEAIKLTNNGKWKK